MRIYNGTNSLVTLPISGMQQIAINPRSVSVDFMGSTDFISMLVTSFDINEVALVVSGPYELSVCATVPTAVNYVVQTLDEAIQRFATPKETETKKVEEKTPETNITEEKPIEHEKEDYISLPSDVETTTTDANTTEPEVKTEVEPEEPVIKLKPKRTRRSVKAEESASEGEGK